MRFPRSRSSLYIPFSQYCYAMVVMDNEQAVSFRLAQRRDAGVAARVVMRAYQPYVARMGVPPAPMRSDYKAVIAKSQVWLAEDGWTLLGLLVVESEPEGLLIHNVAVDPDFHNRGVGRRLLMLAEDLARQAGHGQIRIYANQAMVESKVFYERHGYQEFDRREEGGYQRIYLYKLVD